jgi:hypothetical protein
MKLIQKTFKCNKRRAEMTLATFEVNLGLRIHDEWNGEDFWLGPEPVRTTIPPDAYILKDQQPTFWQRVRKFFVGYY